jgi:prepilin-type N-terminal cleavage/methylation domain-containing protein
MRREGFTLLELLAAVAIIGVVVGLLLPVLAGVKGKTRAVQCLSRLRQFSIAVASYSGEQADSLPLNRPGVFFKPQQTWVRGWLWGSSLDATNMALLENSMLGPYLQDTKLWRCSGDESTVKLGGKVYARNRSLSMNEFVGAPTAIANRTVYRKMSDFGETSPSEVWVMTDESPDTLDDGTFAVAENFKASVPKEWRIADLPGVFHQRGTGMNFADGHAGIVLWSDRRTLTAYFGYQPMPGNQDLIWLEQHSSPLVR